MIAFGFLTGGTLMISGQALYRPVESYDRTLGVAILLGALRLICLSVRAFRRMRAEQAQTDCDARLIRKRYNRPRNPERGRSAWESWRA